MFLHLLNNKEKEYFYYLATMIVSCDDNVSSEETSLLDEYKRELGGEYITPEKTLDLAEIIEVFTDSSQEVKNAIYLESTALTLADDKFMQPEDIVLSKLGQAFNIDNIKKDLFIKAVIDIKNVYQRINELIRV